MTYKKNWWKHTIFTLLLALLFFLTVQAVIFIAVRNTGEFLHGQELVEEHKKRGGLYQTALTDDTYSLGSKLARLEYFNDAKIIALGSSRVLLFEQSMFKQPFVNVGTSMNIMNLRYAKDKIIALSKPEYVLLGLDFWWFHPSNKKLVTKETENVWAMSILNPPFSLGKLYFSTKLVMTTFAKWLLKGNIDQELLAYFYRPLFGNNDYITKKDLGVGALKYGSGVDLRGTYRYDWVFKEHNHDSSKTHFSNIIKRVEEGKSGFEYADATTDELWNSLLKIIKDFEDNGINVIMFLPPVGGRVADKMTEIGKYGILEDIKSRAKQADIRLYDFHDPSKFDSDDCEFLDGFHGGEVTYRRIITHIARDNPTTIAKHVKLEHLQKQIAYYAGRAVARDTKYASDKIEKERDFLGIGCKK